MLTYKFKGLDEAGGLSDIMSSFIFKCRLLLILFAALFGLSSKAQIGYQVSLLDTETGEPRANETVEVLIEITDSEGNIIISESKSATTNGFGLLSLTIGNAQSFANMDWSKLPLWISATIEDKLIGKSQILNVPVAEYAKSVGTISKELLCSKTWVYEDPQAEYDKYSITFNSNGTGINTYGDYSVGFEYLILNNNQIAVFSRGYAYIAIYFLERGWIYYDEHLYK